ncbi:MAG: DUF3108 domain-containing protein [Deltaproteobacteria bacterium]|nr:DUF3108 domain-containing protein [Deltaproteobacteria bacterium]
MTIVTRLLAVIVLSGALFLGTAGFPGATSSFFPPDFPLPDENLLRTAYGGEETMRYSVSWMGVTAGELFMQVVKQQGEGEHFLISVKVKSTGLLDVFYPVEDSFTTTVTGALRLPRHYEMIQREGRRKNNKTTVYDQGIGRITYGKNNDAPQVFEVDGPVHNEFSSFLFLRVMSFGAGTKSILPAFADEKRHKVEITVDGRDTLETILGKKSTLRVKPHLTFKGLYQKAGAPLIWMTDDSYRIPVEIKAKIVIGALTATLVEYQGPAGIFTVGEN